MFKTIKHKVILKNGEIISLDRPEFFTDKKVFWDAHRGMLDYLCQQICMQGFPLQINDIIAHTSITISSKKQLNKWWSENQPGTCNCKK